MQAEEETSQMEASELQRRRRRPQPPSTPPPAWMRATKPRVGPHDASYELRATGRSPHVDSSAGLDASCELRAAGSGRATGCRAGHDASCELRAAKAESGPPAPIVSPLSMAGPKPHGPSKASTWAWAWACKTPATAKGPGLAISKGRLGLCMAPGRFSDRSERRDRSERHRNKAQTFSQLSDEVISELGDDALFNA